MGRPRSWVMAKEDAGSGSWMIFLTFLKQNRGGIGMFFPMSVTQSQITNNNTSG